jgi:hypothetical protein
LPYERNPPEKHIDSAPLRKMICASYRKGENMNKPIMKGFIQVQKKDKYETIGTIALWEKPVSNATSKNYPDFRGEATLKGYENVKIALWKVK